MIPETQKENNDLIDLLTTSFQEVEEIEIDGGGTQKQLVINPETAYWQLHKVNSPTFGRFVFMLKQFESRGSQAFSNMSRERAQNFAAEVRAIVKSYRHSIDAKSSESLRDKNNTERTLIDILKSNRVERAYVMKDEAKKSLIAGFLGKDQERDAQND